jgi:hypothetical protein
MGLDSLFENDEEYKSSLNYILIKNNVCKSIKQINYDLNKGIDDAKRKGVSIYEDIRKNDMNYQKALENKKKKMEEEKKSSKPKFGNHKY